MNIITITENVCFFCNRSTPDQPTFSIANGIIGHYHEKCWQERTCGEPSRDFYSHEEWRLYAGDEWDFREHIWIDGVGTDFWFKNNQLHREDGPAVIYADAATQWYLEGDEYSKETHKLEMDRRRRAKTYAAATANGTMDFVIDAEGNLVTV